MSHKCLINLRKGIHMQKNINICLNININMNPAIQIFLGYIMADFLGGFFHWFEDTYLDYDSKIPLFNGISKHNEMHHYFPRTIVGYSYFENISTTLPIIAALFLIIVYFYPKSVSQNPYFYASLFIFGTLTNVFHRLSHMRECELPSIILFLQNIGLLCSHTFHRTHHTQNNDSVYCPISTYLNLFLDNIGFWRFLENIIYFITGVKPNRKPKYEEYKEIQTHLHENAKMECPDVPTRDDIDKLIIILDEYMKGKSRLIGA
jgi:hypothetical protein